VSRRCGYALQAGCVAETAKPGFFVLGGAAASSVIISRIRSPAARTGMLTADEVSKEGQLYICRSGYPDIDVS